ncbi:MAG: SPOR domain-containing protein [Burkholderiales bacterium]|nr:SPOR domain-containing protein [Burkholderiales bacterium]
MRALFLFFVAANLAFFAWTAYFAPPDAGRDPQPLGRQIAPERLPILPAETGVQPGAPAHALGPPARACLEWGAFAPAEATRAREALAALALGERLAERRSEETAHWWVFIPPQANRQAAQKKAAELKALGIDDYFIVQEDGPARWAVSLGVFTSERAAQSHLEALRARGVRTAQLAQREVRVPKVWLQVRDADQQRQAALREIARSIEGSELRECPAGG